jgi:translation initiation factor 1
MRSEDGDAVIFVQNEDPFKEDDVTIHLRLLTRGRKKLTILQGLSLQVCGQEKVLSAIKKEFHCSGGIGVEPPYGSVIKLSGDHRHGLSAFLIRTGLPGATNIEIHGV